MGSLYAQQTLAGRARLSPALLLALLVSSRSHTEESPIRAVLSGSMGGSTRASTGAQLRLTQQGPTSTARATMVSAARNAPELRENLTRFLDSVHQRPPLLSALGELRVLLPHEGVVDRSKMTYILVSR